MSTADRVKQAFDDCPFDSEPVPIKHKAAPPPLATGNPGPSAFPMDVYPDDIAGSFAAISLHYNIPLDYLGVTGLFAIASMAGNIYRGDLNGGIKPILYTCMVGPSGVGKTPAYKHLCANIIAPLRKQTAARYIQEYDNWKEEREHAKANKLPFTKEPPVKKVRMITDATLEAITKYAELCPAGFGVVYDEGGRFFTGANAYKKDTSSVDFWNELWNGSGYEILRVDSERDRYIHSSATSVLIGMQRDRLLKFFNEDTIASGLLNRFLLCESDYVLLNEQSNAFAPGIVAAESWQRLITHLYNTGVNFLDGDEIMVPFEEGAKQAFTAISNEMLREANRAIIASKKDDDSRLMIAYVSKLAAYLPRLALVLAIIERPVNTVIMYEHVMGAKKLYDYFKQVAAGMLLKINNTATSGLNENELKLYNALPAQFTTDEAQMICEEIGMSRSYFGMQFRRKLSQGWIKKIDRGVYIKE